MSTNPFMTMCNIEKSFNGVPVLKNVTCHKTEPDLVTCANGIRRGSDGGVNLCSSWWRICRH